MSLPSQGAFNAEAELWKATAKSAQALAVHWKNERDRAIETRENANAVSVRAELEIRRLRDALTTAQGEAYLGALAGDDTPDPLAACHNVLKVCLEALSA